MRSSKIKLIVRLQKNKIREILGGKTAIVVYINSFKEYYDLLLKINIYKKLTN